MNLKELHDVLPEQAKRHVDPDSPLPMRMMAAKGMAPLPPVEMVLVVCSLSQDEDAKLASSARETLGKLPDNLLGVALAANLPAVALAILAPALLERPAMLEKVVLNRATPDASIAQIAPHVSAEVAEIIVGNQERCLRSEAIVHAVAENQAILRSSLDRMFDFLVRSGVIHGDLPEYAEAMARLSPTQLEEVAQAVELPPEVTQATEETAEDDSRADTAAEVLDGEHPEEAEERIPMLKLVASLNVAQKVALALRGNKEARSILVRDTNKVVSAAAIKSPKVTEQEIIGAAKSRSISDEVIRVICNSKQMTRSYGVKLALVHNPKAPLPTAMRFLSLLRANDLKAIAKSRNVPSSLANQAKRMLLAKGK